MSDLYDGNYYDDKNLSPSVPLKHTRIGYNNLTQSVTATSQQAGFEATALDNPFTFEIWKPSIFPASIVCDLGTVNTIDYLGLAAHTLSNCKLVIESSLDNITYQEVTNAVILKDTTIMLLFEPVQARYVRITITGYATEATFISDFVAQSYEEGTYSATGIGSPTEASCSVVYVGLSLAMQRQIYGGHSPSTLSRNTTYNNNRSDGGQWLGRSIVRRGETTSFTFNNLSASWYRENFDPFVASAERNPFFIAWRPDGYANEVVYGQTAENIQPENQGLRDFMSVALNVVGYRGTEE